MRAEPDPRLLTRRGPRRPHRLTEAACWRTRRCCSLSQCSMCDVGKRRSVQAGGVAVDSAQSVPALPAISVFATGCQP